MAIVKITKAQNEKVYVRCPFNEGFIKDAKNLKGHWNPTLKMWIFPKNTDIECLGDCLESIFGPSAFNGKFRG